MSDMNRQFQTLTFLYRHCLVAFVLFWGYACGIEVGNPTEPTPNQPKVNPAETATVESTEPLRLDVRNLVENQYDEAITATLENYGTEEIKAAAAALNLLAGNDSHSCGEQTDGSLVLSHQETQSDSRNSGDTADSRVVTESFSRVLSSRMQSTGINLLCKTDKLAAAVDWSKLTQLNIVGSMDRTNSRSVALESNSAIIRESSVKSTGNIATDIKKLQYDATTGMQLQRVLNFATDMEITAKNLDSAPTLFSSRLETLADGPITIEENYGANLLLKSMKIVSGAVSSRKIEDGLVVILRYDNVVLEADKSCRPTSGTVKGEIYTSNNLKTITDTFTLEFGETDNTLIYADGAKSKLEFEPCRIDTHPVTADTTQGDGKGDGKGGNDGGWNGGRR